MQPPLHNSLSQVIEKWCARQELNLRPTGSKAEIGSIYKTLIFGWSTAFFSNYSDLT